MVIIMVIAYNAGGGTSTFNTVTAQRTITAGEAKLLLISVVSCLSIIDIHRDNSSVQYL